MNEDQGFSLIKLNYLLDQKMHTKFEYIEIHVGVWAPFLQQGLKRLLDEKIGSQHRLSLSLPT
jgi:hypothetical protein